MVRDRSLTFFRNSVSMLKLPYAHGGPPVQAHMRQQPEDFQVEELPACEPDGTGDHAWLQVWKRGENTEWVARELARFAGCKLVDVGFAGLKDRHAVTTQIFTVHLPGKPSPDWDALALDSVKVLAATRHRRKLKRGANQGNRFRLLLRDVCGDVDALEQRLTLLRDQGFPNYFGEQRFGHEGRNLDLAQAMFQGRRVSRSKRSLLLSSARAQLFNLVLARRVEDGSWKTGLAGEIWSLSGSRSWFGPESMTEELARRCAAQDIHPSGPMWGRGAPLTDDAAQKLETEVLANESALREGLESAGLSQDRRSLRVVPGALSWQRPSPETLQLEFVLPSGSYATSLMREICAPHPDSSDTGSVQASQ